MRLDKDPDLWPLPSPRLVGPGVLAAPPAAGLRGGVPGPGRAERRLLPRVRARELSVSEWGGVPRLIPTLHPEEPL